MFNSLEIKKIKIRIIKKFKEQRLLTPSIKLNPLIKTKKKNEIIKTLKNSKFIKLFKNFILVSISISLLKYIKKNNNIDCINNLILGESVIFRSDNKPIQKNNPQIIINKLLV